MKKHEKVSKSSNADQNGLGEYQTMTLSAKLKPILDNSGKTSKGAFTNYVYKIRLFLTT